MKNTTRLVFFLLSLASSVAAQFVSPVPVIEREVRDNSSVKLRSIELDRVKRDAKKTSSEKIGPASVNNFLEIKEDFEKIQLLESNIVTVYTTGKQIEFARIAAFSDAIAQSASRLKKNLFPLQIKEQPDPPADPQPQEKETILSGEVKILIVELDNTIGAFVSNPIFVTPKRAKLKEREKAAADLERVIKISIALKQEAEKQTRPKN